MRRKSSSSSAMTRSGDVDLLIDSSLTDRSGEPPCPGHSPRAGRSLRRFKIRHSILSIVDVPDLGGLTPEPRNLIMPQPDADPIHSEERLCKLRSLGLLDTPAEPRFDRLTGLAARFLGVPVALVSLVDDRRQFFKSMTGLSEPWA